MIDMNQALVDLYPQVTTIRQGVAYDAENNVIEYDLAAVQAKAEQNEQALESSRQSALTKLAALGLTDAEIKALTGN